MYLNESEDMIYVACTHFDTEMQNGKLGIDKVYEGSYEQAFDTVIDELEKREKEIEELKKDNAHQWEERCRLTFELEEMQSELDKEKEKNKKLLVGKFREVADKNSYIKDMYINKDKIREIIYPSPDNYIPVEVQMSEMYRKIEKLLKESEINENN